MVSDMLEKLTKIIMLVPPITAQCVGRAQGKRYYTARHVAEHLVKNGVTFIPNRVYQTDGERVYELEIKGVMFDCGPIIFDDRAIGKSVFLTREEAERHDGIFKND